MNYSHLCLRKGRSFTGYEARRGRFLTSYLSRVLSGCHKVPNSAPGELMQCLWALYAHKSANVHAFIYSLLGTAPQ